MRRSLSGERFKRTLYAASTIFRRGRLLADLAGLLAATRRLIGQRRAADGSARSSSGGIGHRAADLGEDQFPNPAVAELDLVSGQSDWAALQSPREPEPASHPKAAVRGRPRRM